MEICTTLFNAQYLECVWLHASPGCTRRVFAVALLSKGLSTFMLGSVSLPSPSLPPSVTPSHYLYLSLPFVFGGSHGRNTQALDQSQLKTLTVMKNLI